MTAKNIIKYAEECWRSERYYNTIAKISASDNGVPLVNSSYSLYWFDNISKDLYCDRKNNPASADGILLTPKVIYVIEFKSGFKKKISKHNFNKDIAQCEHLKGICEHYWKLFFDKQQLETEALINSLRNKAIESYITLEKRILPKCIDLCTSRKVKLCYLAVIDEDAIDNMENVLSELSSQKGTLESNCFNDIRKSLSSFVNHKDVNSCDYFYDEIQVKSITEFIAFIDNIYKLSQ